MPTRGLRFLEPDATADPLLRAIESHHRQWLVYSARFGGGEVRRESGVTWVRGPDGYYSSVAFPRLRSATADAQIDRIVAYYRGCRPRKLVIWWSLEPAQPPDLEARLLTRGFEPCWPLNWMWLDLEQLRSDFPRTPGLQVDLIQGEVDWDVEDLPHYSREIAAWRCAASRARPRRLWQFGAWLEGKPVGHSTLFITTGRLGIAGIWGCGVVPEARNRGVGKAVTLVACEYARALGCRCAMLNATGMGEPVYRRLGFEKIGAGVTWMLRPEAQRARRARGPGELRAVGRVP
jgi:GNAT superfamily N-acetyltransferase